MCQGSFASRALLDESAPLCDDLCALHERRRVRVAMERPRAHDGHRVHSDEQESVGVDLEGNERAVSSLFHDENVMLVVVIEQDEDLRAHCVALDHGDTMRPLIVK